MFLFSFFFWRITQIKIFFSVLNYCYIKLLFPFLDKWTNGILVLTQDFNELDENRKWLFGFQLKFVRRIAKFGVFDCKVGCFEGIRENFWSKIPNGWNSYTAIPKIVERVIRKSSQDTSIEESNLGVITYRKRSTQKRSNITNSTANRKKDRKKVSFKFATL